MNKKIIFLLFVYMTYITVLKYMNVWRSSMLDTFGQLMQRNILFPPCIFPDLFNVIWGERP